jgi:hypothetical protein
MKINITTPQQFEVIPDAFAAEDKPLKIIFREPKTCDINMILAVQGKMDEFYKEMLCNCFVNFENKPEIEIDCQTYQYFDYAGLLNAGNSPEIAAIHLECLNKMIEVYNKQSERAANIEKKSVSHGKSTKAED